MENLANKIIFIIVVFLSNIVQAITGFAGTVLAMPFSILLVGKDYAKPILNVIALVVCLIIAVKYRKNIDWKMLLFCLIFMGIGMGVGLVIEKYFTNKIILKIYGGLICAVAIYYFFVKKAFHIPLFLEIIIMILAGLIHGIFVSGGPLLIIVAKNRIQDKTTFRATLSMIWIILNSIIFTSDIVQGHFVMEQLIVIGILIPTVLLSLVIGKLLLNHVSNELFMKITCVLLLISGISLII